MTSIWKGIDTFEGGDRDGAIVDNGERIGEAVLYESYEYDDDEEGYPLPRLRWRWANHGSCGCCWGDMKPQPTMWTPLPVRDQ